MSQLQNTERDFGEDGLTVLRSFLDAERVLGLQGNLDRFIAEVLPGLPDDHVYYENKNESYTLKQIQQLGKHDAFFRELQNDSEFRRVAERLLDGPVVPRNLQFFNKPPGVGQPTPPHQDGHYFMLDPCEAVTMWLALDPADEENGCVRYVPGSHRKAMREHRRTTTLGFSQGIIDYPTAEDAKNEIAMVARPGDLLVHHALTIHRADGNPSSRSRRSIGFIYYSERAREDVAAQARYQEKLADELRARQQI